MKDKYFDKPQKFDAEDEAFFQKYFGQRNPDGTPVNPPVQRPAASSGKPPPRTQEEPPVPPVLPVRSLPLIMSVLPGPLLQLQQHNREKPHGVVHSSRLLPATGLPLPVDLQRHPPQPGDRRILPDPFRVRRPVPGLLPIHVGLLPPRPRSVLLSRDAVFLPKRHSVSQHSSPRSVLLSRDAVFLPKRHSVSQHSRDVPNSSELPTVPPHPEQYPGLSRSPDSASRTCAAETLRLSLLPDLRSRRKSSGEKNGIIPFCGSCSCLRHWSLWSWGLDVSRFARLPVLVPALTESAHLYWLVRMRKANEQIPSCLSPSTRMSIRSA